MKKRAIEAAAILIILIALFIGVNLIAGGVESTSVRIDNEYYNTGERELSLTLMTEEGLDELSRFTRLKSLKVIPYKAAVINSLSGEDEQYNELVRRETESTYFDCTDLEDISFVTLVPNLERLDISYCSVSDISCLGEMGSISELNIAYTNVTELSVLAELDNITELVITGIPAHDISPLLEMDGLVRVRMSKGTDDETAAALEEKGVIVELFEKTNA